MRPTQADHTEAMFPVAASLIFVAALTALGAALGVVLGLYSHITAGVTGRPEIYWLFAAAIAVGATLFWPTLLSWYLHLRLPAWHRRALTTTPQDRGKFEDVRASRRVVDMARAADPAHRSAIARAVLGYGIFYVLLAVPLPLMLGVAAARPGSGLRPEEALPLLAGVALPAAVSAVLLGRRSRGAY